MCFVTKLDDRFKVAKDDIVCYKIMIKRDEWSPDEYQTPFQEVMVHIGETLTGKANACTLEEANAMLDSKAKVEEEFLRRLGFDLILITPDLRLREEVVHACKWKEDAVGYAHDYLESSTFSYGIKLVITKWIIPKGAFYMTNSDDEIVASRMTFSEVI